MITYPIEFRVKVYKSIKTATVLPKKGKYMMKLDVAHKKFIEQLKSEGKSEATLVAYSKDIEQLTLHLGKQGIEAVSGIQLQHLEDFMTNLASNNYTPKSISRKTNAARTFLKFLQKNGYVDGNIAELLKHPKLDVKAPKILSKVEYRALRDSAKDDLRSYTMIEVLLQTGLTISELAEMKLEETDLKGDVGNLFVPKKNNKDARNIPLNKAVVDALRKYIENDRPKLENSKHVFITKTGKPLLVRNIRSTIDRYFKLAGIGKAKVNDLRHTFVAHHLANGMSILQLSKIAGHKRVSTTERYLQYIERVETDEKTELMVL
jgi:site-specific recombinase XerD